MTSYYFSDIIENVMNINERSDIMGEVKVLGKAVPSKQELEHYFPELLARYEIASFYNHKRVSYKVIFEDEYTLDDFLWYCDYIEILPDDKREELFNYMCKELNSFGILECAHNTSKLKELSIEYRVNSLLNLERVLDKVWDKGDMSKHMKNRIRGFMKDIAGYVPEGVMKNLGDRAEEFDRDRHYWVNRFMSDLKTGYDESDLKKIYRQMIKEDHPDNGGKGNGLEHIERAYNILRYDLLNRRDMEE